VPLLAYVHAPQDGVDRRFWEPRWRVWRWVIAALVVGYAASRSGAALGTLLAFVVFGLVCQAVAEALPYGRGLSEWRQ
jgi:hypothetical protein